MGVSLGAICYGIIAVLALSASWREARRRSSPQPRRIWRLAGMGLCILWPLAIVAMGVAILLDKRRRPASATPGRPGGLHLDPALQAQES